jgi:hypothetical protein
VFAALLVVCAVFAPGEKLEYDVKYGPFTFGRLALHAVEPDTVRGETCHHFRAELELSRSLAWLFWAKYRLESWARTSDFVTLRSYKRTREPNYRAEWTAEFLPAESCVRYSTDSVYPLPDSCRDMLTAWYLFRTLDLGPGDTVRVNVHADRRNYRLTVAVTAGHKVRTPAGRFDCLSLNPNVGSPLQRTRNVCRS